jgi:lipoprotein NlpI
MATHSLFSEAFEATSTIDFCSFQYFILRSIGLFELDPSGDQWYFRMWLVRARLGEEAAATQELRAYLDHRKTRGGGDWDLQIGLFLTGQLSEADLLQVAAGGKKAADLLQSESGAKKASEQQSRAYFYAGTKRLIKGDKKTAAAYFENCLKLGNRVLLEFESAASELRFLKAGY